MNYSELEKFVKEEIGCGERKGLHCDSCAHIYDCMMKLGADLRSVKKNVTKAIDYLAIDYLRWSKKESDAHDGT